MIHSESVTVKENQPPLSNQKLASQSSPNQGSASQKLPHQRATHQILEGTTWHVRYLPSKHKFNYPYRYWGLNLNLLAKQSNIKLPAEPAPSFFNKLFLNWLFSDKNLALHSFDYQDYFDINSLDDSNQDNADYLNIAELSPKDTNVAQLNKTQLNKEQLNKATLWLKKVEQQFKRLTTSIPEGDIIALVVGRNLGFYFSPVNFYLGFDTAGNVSHLLAEVSNTPWNKTHYYGFLLTDYQNGDTATFSHNKNFHVSPFNPLDQVYTWKVKVSNTEKKKSGKQSSEKESSEKQSSEIQNCTESNTTERQTTEPCFTDIRLGIYVSDNRGKVFEAGINMHSKPLNAENIQHSIRQNPIMNYSSMGRIYWHAFILYARKKVAYIDYNQKLDNSKQSPLSPISPSLQKQGIQTMTDSKKVKKPTERNSTRVLDKLISNPLLSPVGNSINASLNSACKLLLYKLLGNFKFGQVTLIETYHKKAKIRQFGNVTDKIIEQKKGEIAGNHPLLVTVRIHNPNFYQKVITGGSIALADSYIDEDWDVDDLTALIRLGARNLSAGDKIESKFSRFTKAIEKNKHKLRQNTISNSKSNILAHYDLGNDMYQTFLDDAMMYSSAVYDTPKMSLNDAQQLKLKTLCEQLELTADDKVIEIGTGWGGFAIYAATHYGCHVTTTTISDAQYDEAKHRVEQAGLSDKITLLKEDYRNLTGKYDKLISVEMVEAVGHEYLPTFFNKCNELLKENGIMTIQAITFNDQGYADYLNSVDFIQSHIFPGGCLLSNQEIVNQFTNETDMVVKSLIDYGYDYAYTLRDWRHAFMSHLDDIRAMGYDEAFIRLWHFYFAYSEGGFLEKTISVVQVKAVKPERR